MPTGRKTGGYSPAYEKRLKAFFKKNPHGTLAEARGHKNKKPDTTDTLKLTEYAIKEKIKLQHVKKRLGIITEKETAKNITDLQALRRNVQKLETIPTRTLEYWQNREKSAKLYKELRGRGVVGGMETDWLANLLFYHGG